MANIYLDPASDESLDLGAWIDAVIAAQVDDGIRSPATNVDGSKSSVDHEAGVWLADGKAMVGFTGNLASQVPPWTGTFIEATGRSTITLYVYGRWTTDDVGFDEVSLDVNAKINASSVDIITSNSNAWASVTFDISDRTYANFEAGVVLTLLPTAGIGQSRIEAMYLDFGADWTVTGSMFYAGSMRAGLVITA